MFKILAVTVTLLLASAAQSQQPKNSTGPAAAQDQRGTESLPLVVKGIPASRPADETQREIEKIHIDREMLDLGSMNVRVAWLLLFVAALQAGMFGWQLRLMRQASAIGKDAADAAKASADMASAQFIATHRPQLTLRHIALDRGQGNDCPPITVRYTVVNTGYSTATIAAVSARLWLPMNSENLPPEPPYAEPTIQHVGLKSGERRVFSIAASDEISAEWYFREGGASGPRYIDRVDSPDILLLGYIDYEDAERTARRIGFLRQRDRTTQRFEPLRHPDYEYQD